ncbi:MAG: heterodisulfide reductase-related iron-sulfur binding cluster [Acidilobaceae archaeon]|nr:heterodisulfide reductase-related iron-sulfur binding cluster [Acidilobaceae archaeon]MCX8165176.1 heterodisulfide reductase-related iron-sulfur binding cluster [Acidilobaceae archaeon]MDW7974308.1 heterodisulfide reductase-related iron-sulfur binding cluster [Sulfolobales archaeon]
MEEPIIHYFMVEDLRPFIYVAALIAVGIVAFNLFRAYQRWSAGGERVSLLPSLNNLLRYSLLQRKVVSHRLPGALHLLIYLGILWLFVMTNLRAIDTYFFHFLTGDVWKVYKFLGNVAGVAVILGVLIAFVRRERGLTPNLPKDRSYYLIYALLLFLVISGFALNGLLAAAHRANFESPLFDPVGYLFYLAFSGLSFDEIRTYYRGLWVVHMITAMTTIALIPYTNLWHIIASNLNIALARPAPPVGSLRSYTDIDERLSRGVGVGMTKLSASSWKQRMDWDACTSCMRCTNACPAFAAGKPLSPQNVMITLRNLMYAGEWDSQPWGEGKVEADAVWSCVTCGACVHECPVLIHQVDSILDLRRGMLTVGDPSIPEGSLNALTSLQQMGNPFGSSPVAKEEWMEELKASLGDVVAREGEEYDILYWPGCATTYDPRIREVALSNLRLLSKLGYRIAVVPDPVCTGEPALRMGEELLFLEKASEFLEALSKYRFKTLLVSCPHCYTAIRWEYRRYKDYLKQRLGERGEVLERLKVEHHAKLLGQLVKEGKIRGGVLKAYVTYHDPCYLGRWNGIYEEPREVLRSIGRLRLAEMPRNREKSFCCGGGGGQLFYEVRRGERISKLRSEEAAKTLDVGQARKVVAVACPFCNIMFRGEAEQYGFEVKDVAELLEESMRSV